MTDYANITIYALFSIFIKKVYELLVLFYIDFANWWGLDCICLKMKNK